MNNPPVALSLNRKTIALRQHLIEVFWTFSVQVGSFTESERLEQIRDGVRGELVDAIRATFNLSEGDVAMLLNVPLISLKRRQRQQKTLSSIASERLDRIASVFEQAVGVFESRIDAVRWMSSANVSCGYSAPVLLCLTEIGGARVRRVLHALEWGGSV